MADLARLVGGATCRSFGTLSWGRQLPCRSVSLSVGISVKMD